MAQKEIYSLHPVTGYLLIFGGVIGMIGAVLYNGPSSNLALSLIWLGVILMGIFSFLLVLRTPLVLPASDPTVEDISYKGDIGNIPKIVGDSPKKHKLMTIVVRVGIAVIVGFFTVLAYLQMPQG